MSFSRNSRDSHLAKVVHHQAAKSLFHLRHIRKVQETNQTRLTMVHASHWSSRLENLLLRDTRGPGAYDMESCVRCIQMSPCNHTAIGRDFFAYHQSQVATGDMAIDNCQIIKSTLISGSSNVISSGMVVLCLLLLTLCRIASQIQISVETARKATSGHCRSSIKHGMRTVNMKIHRSMLAHRVLIAGRSGYIVTSSYLKHNKLPVRGVSNRTWRTINPDYVIDKSEALSVLWYASDWKELECL